MMITLENTLWVDAVQAIPQLAWRNLHQFRDVPGGMRSVLADEARVRNLPHVVVVVVGVCVQACIVTNLFTIIYTSFAGERTKEEARQRAF
jgi:hypothetical protein